MLLIPKVLPYAAYDQEAFQAFNTVVSSALPDLA